MALIDLTPSRVDFVFVRGDTWRVTFTFPDPSSTTGEALDLTGSTWRSEIKLAGEDGGIDDEAELFTEWDIDDSAQEDGIIVLSVDESVTITADIDQIYWYDLEQTRDDSVATSIQGTIRVVRDVTNTDLGS